MTRRRRKRPSRKRTFWLLLGHIASAICLFLLRPEVQNAISNLFRQLKL